MIFNFCARRLQNIAYALCMTVLVAVLPVHAHAASPADVKEATQESNRIQRDQQLRQQDDIDRSLERHHGQTHIEVPALPAQKGHGTGCVKIAHVVLQNAAHMSKAQQEKIAKPYTGKCLGVDAIQQLLSDITKFYVDKGYVTTRAYLPAQDLSKGTLTVTIVPGKVGSITTDEKTTKLTHLGNIFPNMTGQDLNLRDFEQGIDQINRLLSNNAAIDIRPGAQVGQSDIVIKNKPSKPWHVNVSADNYGAHSTGRYQLGETASLDNLTGYNDFLSFTRRNTVPFGDDKHQSTSNSFLFSIPYGYTTLTAGLTGSGYDSTLRTSSGNMLHLNGNSQTAYLAVDRVVYRDKDGKASVNATLTNDNTNSFIDGQKISVSSRILTYLALGANYNTRLWGGAFNLGGTYTRGLTMLGALEDASNIAGSTPHAQFDKYTVTAGYSRPFAVAKNTVIFSTQFSGQFAPKALYGSQQFSVGGMYTVRGFLDEQLANDDGFYLRNDLTLVKQARLAGRAVDVRPFVAFDIGSVGSRHTGTQNGTLGGTAVGVDLASGPADWNIYAGYPLIYPHGISNEGLNVLTRLSVTF